MTDAVYRRKDINTAQEGTFRQTVTPSVPPLYHGTALSGFHAPESGGTDEVPREKQTPPTVGKRNVPSGVEGGDWLFCLLVLFLLTGTDGGPVTGDDELLFLLLVLFTVGF